MRLCEILRVFAQQKEIQRLQKIIEDLEDVITTVRRVCIPYFHLIDLNLP